MNSFDRHHRKTRASNGIQQRAFAEDGRLSGTRDIPPLTVVERATRQTTAEVHQALFAEGPTAGAPIKTLAELKHGIKEAIRKRAQRGDAGG